MDMIRHLLNSAVFWGAWIIIPFIMEIVPAVGSIYLLLRRRKKGKIEYEKPIVYPEISLIIPVYNSAQTLFACVESIYKSTYPNDKIRIFLVNNQGQDESFEVYAKCQKAFPELAIQWLDSKAGKSRALNLALYNSGGKYIMNLDSDGYLDENALANMVDKFEANPDLNCMTGAILTSPEQIEEYKGFFRRLFRKLEFMEYAQAFMAGRSYAAETDSIYTLSGAFSAFRKSAVLKSRMYNTNTICEDTHITFQMRYILGYRVDVCENAIYYVDPIEDMNKLYTQRQRWQRGSLEVAKQFMTKDMKPSRILKDVNVRTLMYDHTFAFPRLIWYFALLCLLWMNYSTYAVVITTVTIFALYIVVGYVFFVTTLYLMRQNPELQRYYKKQWWVVGLLPFFNFMVFFIRMAGVVNSINTAGSWKVKNYTEEGQEFKNVVKNDFSSVKNVRDRLSSFINNPNMNEKSKGILWGLGVTIVYLLSGLIFVICRWSKNEFGVGANEIINTLMGPLKGTGNETLLNAVRQCVPPMIMVVVVVALVILIEYVLRKRYHIGSFLRQMVALGGVVALLGSLLYVEKSYDLLNYAVASMGKTQIYDTYFVDPNKIPLKSSKKKNVIYIYLESMETTYASAASGGKQGTNYMPNLTEYARENDSFSNTKLLGGSHSTEGTGWTMAALFSTTTGIPYALPADANVIDKDSKFTPGITALGDILEKEGYNQEFLCGSDADFAGRRNFFEQHGNYKIFDLYSARDAGYIPKDYYVWWGFEDKYLFQIAKDEITQLAAEDKPFNFTMLTVDTHHVGGYVCDLCGNKYDNVTANVVSCTDAQLKEFIDWIQHQDFYEDTVIVLTGDHPRMDTNLVVNTSYYDRTNYNCIINSSVSSKNMKNREFTPMDWFPTVLAAMGYEIEGDRLGIGTNLYGETPTLAEEMGFEELNSELGKSSEFYNQTFLQQ